MKAGKFLLSIGLISLSTATAIAQDSPIQTLGTGDTLRLSREQCISIALQENPTIKVADLEVKRVDYSKKEVLANLFPSIDFSGAYQRSIELQTLSMSMGGQSTKIKMGMDNMWNFGFTAAMPIVNASLWKSIKISETQILANLESARASKIDLVKNINQAYYSLLLAIDSRKVIKQSYDIAKENNAVYQKQFEQGTATEYDVLRSAVQISNIEPELLQADIAVKQCQLQLKVLMSIDNTVEIEPTMDLKSMQRDMFGITSAQNLSLDNNTSLRSLDIQSKMAKQNVTLKKFAYIPSLSIQYNMNWNAMSNGNALKNQDFNPYSTVAVALQVPIFSGGSKYYGIKQAQVQLKELEYQRENLTDALKMQIDLAVDNINKQVKQIESSENGMRQAAKAHQIMQKSFEIGAATYLNLRDSELADTQSQLAYYQSIYNYLISTSELEALLGNDSTYSPYISQTR